MAQLTLVLNFLKHDLVIQLGAGISPEDEDEPKEVIVVESTAETERAPVGFTVQRYDEDEEDEDARRSRQFRG